MDPKIRNRKIIQKQTKTWQWELEDVIGEGRVVYERCRSRKGCI